MLELWLAYSLLAILLYGVGQGISKEPLTRVGPARTLLLLGALNTVFYSAYFVLFHEGTTPELLPVLEALASGVVGALGYIFFYEALDRGNPSVVGAVTAAYPALAVLVGLVVLREAISNLQALGLLLVVLAVIFLSREEGGEGSRPGIGLAMLTCLVAWGAWAILEKFALLAMAPSTYGILYVLGSLPVLALYAWRRPAVVPMVARDITASLAPLSLFLVGGLFVIFAFAEGNLSVVAPLTAAYPIVTVIFRRLWARENLAASSAGAVALAIAGTLLTVGL